MTSGLNVALHHARGRWVARMDAHTRYPDDYLARGVARLMAGGTRWVSGPQLPRGDRPVSRAVSLALGTGLGRSGSRKWAAGTDVEAAEYELDSGVFTGVWERASLLEYGGWDERWRVNEDSEMAARFLARGERLICMPAMAATYAPRDSLPRLWRQYFVYGEYRARTARRHPETMRRQHLVAPALALRRGGRDRPPHPGAPARPAERWACTRPPSAARRCGRSPPPSRVATPPSCRSRWPPCTSPGGRERWPGWPASGRRRGGRCGRCWAGRRGRAGGSAQRRTRPSPVADPG